MTDYKTSEEIANELLSQAKERIRFLCIEEGQHWFSEDKVKKLLEEIKKLRCICKMYPNQAKPCKFCEDIDNIFKN